jgi:hypothetical protein
MTTNEVCNEYLKPLTVAKGASYCELLMEQNSPNVGSATLFISHAWKYKFMDVVKTIRTIKMEEGTFIWFDLFSNSPLCLLSGGATPSRVP